MNHSWSGCCGTCRTEKMLLQTPSESNGCRFLTIPSLIALSINLGKFSMNLSWSLSTDTYRIEKFYRRTYFGVKKPLIELNRITAKHEPKKSIPSLIKWYQNIKFNGWGKTAAHSRFGSKYSFEDSCANGTFWMHLIYTSPVRTQIKRYQ